MRGSLTDFYTDRPVAPVVVRFLPDDFDASLIDQLAFKPLAPEVVECERCDTRACHALIRTQNRTLRLECQHILSMEEFPTPKQPRTQLQAEEMQRAILDAFGDGKVLSLYEVIAITHLTYSSTRKYVDAFLRTGELVLVGTRKLGNGGRHNLYCLPEHKPAWAKAYKPRKLGARSVVKERSLENERKVLAFLRSNGAADATTLAEGCALTVTTIHNKLQMLKTQGRVRAVGYRIVMSGSNRTTPTRVTLWGATEESV